ncbi:hypothetical protein B0H19DRAFT_155344 [Mycena capillaripes]|nr:hypothetical protein B0H19DRAFT_155344 [Mycena capillaripes]
MLLDLYVELLQEIAGNLDTDDHRSFRAVCKDINFAMEPLFFSSIALNRPHVHLRFERFLWIFETLATGKTGWSRYARTLKIVGEGWIEEEEKTSNLSDTAMRELFVSALASMKNIQTVSWVVHEGVAVWLRNAMCDYLDTLPFLEVLQVEVDHTALPLGRMLGLRTLKITTPHHRQCHTVQQVSQSVEQSHKLTTLHVHGFNDWSELWVKLTSSQTRLKEIYTNVVTTDLLDYLGSYSGLERLSFMRPDGGSAAKADHLANIFFETVLPRHTDSLVDLACPAGYETRWSFGTHNADIISDLSRLTSLKMSVNHENVADVELTINAVDLLLRTAVQLPDLRSIHISSAEAERHRGVASRTRAMMGYSENVYHAITATVQQFCSYDTSSAILLVNRHYYKLQATRVGGGTLYKDPTVQERVIFAYSQLDTGFLG